MIKAPAFCQRRGPYAANRLGTVNGVTIGEQGCAITCVTSADGADDPNNVWDPGQVDQLFTDQGGYVGYDANGHVTLRSPQEGCGLLDWSAITRLLPNTNHAGADYCEIKAAPVQKLRDWLAVDGQSAVIEVRYGGRESDMHFVLAVRDDGGVIVVMDPWEGDFVDLAGGRFGWPGNLSRIIYAIHYLSDTTPNVQVAPPPVPQPLPTPPSAPAPEPAPLPEPPAPQAPAEDPAPPVPSVPEDTLNYRVTVDNTLVGRYAFLQDAYEAYTAYAHSGQKATITTRDGLDVTQDALKAYFHAEPAPSVPAVPVPSVPAFRLPHLDSATYKGIVVTFFALAPQAMVWLTDPNLLTIVNHFAPGLLPFLTFAAGALAFVVGVLRKDVKLY